MTTPHDHITSSPEYARSYQHYLAQGATPEDAARQAYDWCAQQAAAPRMPVPPKKSRTGLIVVGVIGGCLVAVCLVAGISAALSGSSTTKSASPPAAGAKPNAPKLPGLNQSASDGNFQFTVTSVKCGATTVGKALTKKAQGQFCLVAVTVKNVKKEQRTFDASSQKAFGADGAEFGSDGVASLYVNDNNETFINDINPGNQVAGVVVFDIPKAAKLTKLELHDSAFSGGVEVEVGP